MKIIILSDIHGNLNALTKVLADAKSQGATQIFCLGDIVGFPGDNHRACLELLIERDSVIIAGNHDAVATNKQSFEYFNHLPHIKQKTLEARLDLLKEPSWLYAYLQDLKPMLVCQLGRCNTLLCHGHPLDPYWEYITTPKDVAHAFQAVTNLDLLLVGHSHKAAYGYMVKENNEQSSHVGHYITAVDKLYKDGLNLDFNTTRYLLNPGSIGGNNDPMARYIILHCGEDNLPYRATWHKIAKA